MMRLLRSPDERICWKIFTDFSRPEKPSKSPRQIPTPQPRPCDRNKANVLWFFTEGAGNSIIFEGFDGSICIIDRFSNCEQKIVFDFLILHQICYAIFKVISQPLSRAAAMGFQFKILHCIWGRAWWVYHLAREKGSEIGFFFFAMKVSHWTVSGTGCSLANHKIS